MIEFFTMIDPGVWFTLGTAVAFMVVKRFLGLKLIATGKNNQL